jgi:hypothetical protein
MRNLALLPSKRTRSGIAQASLALDVVHRYILGNIATDPESRIAFPAVRRVIALATDNRIAPVAFDHGLEILSAVPALQIPSSAFQSEAWPRAVDAVKRLREKHQALTARREELRRRKKPKTD